MARFLFVVPPLVGHINPTLSVAAALSERGHEVAWSGFGAVLEHLLPEGARFFALDDEETNARLLEAADKGRTLRGLPGLKFLWEDVLVPLAREMAPGVREAVDAFEPDVMIVDQQALAGSLVARATGKPWATFATTSADRQESLAELPKVMAWTEERLAELQRELIGGEPVPGPELSPHRIVVFSTEALIGSVERFPAVTRFVGPAFSSRPVAPTDFPWDQLRDVPRVFVSLGTLNAERGERFFRALSDALGDLPLQVILVAPDEFGPFPENFIVRPFVPQLEVLEKVDAVVSHGGHNTVAETLARSLPLVVAPIKDDQPVIAKQVTEAGCGLRLSFTRPRPALIREAVQRVLAEPSFREAADRIRVSFEQAGGASRAADLLEELLPGAEAREVPA